MNAPDKTAVLKRVQAMEAQLVAEQKAARIHAAQPKVGCNQDCELLLSEYDHDGLLLDFYGNRDHSFGYEVTDVALAGQDICITDLFTTKKLSDFGYHCERVLPSRADIKQKAYESFMSSQA